MCYQPWVSRKWSYLLPFIIVWNWFVSLFIQMELHHMKASHPDSRSEIRSLWWISLKTPVEGFQGPMADLNLLFLYVVCDFFFFYLRHSNLLLWLSGLFSQLFLPCVFPPLLLPRTGFDNLLLPLKARSPLENSVTCLSGRISMEDLQSQTSTSMDWLSKFAGPSLRSHCRPLIGVASSQVMFAPFSVG